MRVIYKKIPFKKVKCVVTIGVFDGVHLGHKFILEKLREKSRQLNLPSLVVTFDVPPQILLSKKNPQRQKRFPGFLTDLKSKAEFLKQEGIDYVWFLKTSKPLLALSGREFIDYLFSHFIVKFIIVGEDFRFGRNGRSSIRYLEKVSRRYGFGVKVLKKITKTKNIISSSLIRRFIKKSYFSKIENFLGRKFYIEGKVVKGRGYGRRLGYPTANVDYDGFVIPEAGVYAAYIKIDKKQYLSAVNIGVRPTVVKSLKKILEAHVFNFKKNILGKKIRIRFIEKLRDEKKFYSERELKQAIANDISYIKIHYKV
ncbi:MAG: bifunctional riboflavin kinase/FAD synthetase [Candidatus Omnitrophota bacterium]|jgi:riboflavin kinase/FMN adenylyltransferase